MTTATKITVEATVHAPVEKYGKHGTIHMTLSNGTVHHLTGIRLMQSMI